MFDSFWNGEIYQNFPSSTYLSYRWNYWAESFPLLLRIKEKYDPSYLFQFAQSISPDFPLPMLWPPETAKVVSKPIVG
jgi:hypothetical protein